MKPILFNTEMVQVILNGRKTVTRRVVKLPHCGYFEHEPPLGVVPPYRPGDVLYVRETWATWLEYRKAGATGHLEQFYYKASSQIQGSIKWHPSIHMPREAARIFLRVTEVMVERLQDITDEQAALEGARKEYQHYGDNIVTKREFFSGMWNSTIKPPDRTRYGWDANPWVWVIGFERISKEEALQNET